MRRIYTFKRSNDTENKYIEIYGDLKGKSMLMVYSIHLEMQSKWDKPFWARGYYVETIGNIMNEAVEKYIKEQAKE